MPYPTDAPEREAFFAPAAQPCWCDYRCAPATAAGPVYSDAAVAQASLTEIKTMLTDRVRGERFRDGHWRGGGPGGPHRASLCRLRQSRDTVPWSPRTPLRPVPASSTPADEFSRERPGPP